MQQPQQGSDNYAAGGGVTSQEMLSFGSSSGAPRGQMLGGEAEAASPISSRPPASINFDELRDAAARAETDPDRGGGGGSVSSGNRWPRQETLALLNIRSEMDVAFRDATLKGPLWDEVSRKLAELGYVRSAKKCKEKFENVHKYYKRTKEGRAGRQDGKSYRFFTQLEAMQGAATASGSVGVGGGSGGVNLISSNITPAMTTSGPPPPPIGNIQFGTPASAGAGGVMRSGVVPSSQPFMLYSSGLSAGVPAAPGSGPPPPVAPIGISFSSDSGSSGSFDSEEEEVDDVSEEEELFGAAAAGSGQKRKRGSSKSGSSGKRRMMEFFEGLMRQVMQKQEAMQQRFLEIIEKREQDRLMRDEAWKRQEAARLSREQELVAQERAIAASRDAAIVSFLQKITGQTIQLPQPVYTSVAPPLSSAPVITTPTPPPASRQQFQQMVQQQVQHHQSQHRELIRQQQQQQQMPPPSTDAIMAVPERQILPQELQTGGSSSEPTSSRWPKAEVLALIKLRSNLENRYQEAGPKGPLWEEISAGMQQMGYNRSSKRCKEKWENINKYFKKVKESNKKRPEDAKTCPYFNELDALYQRKKLSTSSSSSIAPFQLQPAITIHQETPASNPEGTVLASSAPVESVPELTQGPGQAEPIFNVQETNAGASTKPEDIMKERQVSDQKMDELLDDENEGGENDRKMGYKIEFQRSSTSNNKNGASSASFITMVQ